jgi:hypothetical protein
VKKRFQAFASKCNLYRYTAGRLRSAATLVTLAADPRRRRVLTAQGLAPRLMRAALQLCALAAAAGKDDDGGGGGGMNSKNRGKGKGGGVIEAALAPPPRTLRLAASSLLYLASLDLRAADAAAAFAERDTAPILAALLEPAHAPTSSGSRGGGAGAALGAGGFGALLAGRVGTPGCQIGYMDLTGCHQLLFFDCKITW